MKYNILHLAPDFNLSDGRSYYVYLVLKYLKRTGHNVFLFTNGGNSFKRLNEQEIPVISCPGLSNKYTFLRSLHFLNRIIAENSIELLHSHHRYYELLSNSVKARKKICTVSTALSIVDKKYFVEYRSDKIIAVSHAVKSMLIQKFKVSEDKIILVPNFVDTEELSEKITTKSNSENNVTYILSVGRFDEQKNHITLLEAISLLKKYKIELTLVGEGSEKSLYQNFITENSLNVKLIAPQYYLKYYFDHADICVLSSIRDPFPGFMLQSGLHKKPFIGSNADGISEMITHGKNGLLFEMKTPYDLAINIQRFIEDKKLLQDCAENLHRDVIDNYTEKTVMPKIENVYYDLLK